MFALTIRTTGGAFFTDDGSDEGAYDPTTELARLLREAADRVEMGFIDNTLMDINGQLVGKYGLVEDNTEAKQAVSAYLDEMDRIEAIKPQYADAVHTINLIELRRSDLRKLV